MEERDTIQGLLKSKVAAHLLARLSYIALGVFYISIATVIWNDFGYLDLGMLIPVWIILVMAGMSLIIGSSMSLSTTLTRYFLLFLLPGIAAFFAVMVQKYPVYGTDEIAIDTYAAYLFLHGIDPYINSNMVNVFYFYHLPFYFVTPLLKGGYVTYLTYPGLSVLLFVPAVLFHFQSSFMLITFNLASFIVLYAYYRKTGYSALFPFSAFLLLIDINWIFYSVGGVTDIVWVVLLALAYIERKSPLISGLFFGLAVAFKQTPAVIFPFFLYFIYMESGRSRTQAAVFTLSTLSFFLLSNLPFIFMNPTAWVHNVVGVADQPILGIGMGVSILYFAGFLHLASYVFYAIPAVLLLLLFVLYVGNYEKMKLSFFAMPVIPFIFYYRLLVNYVLYWPYLILLMLPEIITAAVAYERSAAAPSPFSFSLKSFRSRKAETVLLTCLIVAGGAVTAFGFVTNSHEPFKIVSVGGFSDPADLPDMITMMNVTVQYMPSNGEAAYQPVYFRILGDTGIISANGLLWTATDPVLSAGMNKLQIVPNTQVDMLPAGLPFRLIAYYGSYMSSYNVPGVQLNQTLLFVNPYFINPVSEPFGSLPPGWSFGPNDAQGKGYISTSYEQFTLTTVRNSAQAGWATSEIYDAGINLTGLALGGYTLSYNLLFNANSTIRSSNVTAYGYPNLFYGVQFGFENLTKQIWVGYNSSVNFELLTPSSTLIVILSNRTVVNFSTVYEIAQRLGWNTDDCIFSYLVGSWSVNGIFSANFNSFELNQV